MGPDGVQWAWAVGIQASPRLAAAAPVKKAHRTRVKIAAATLHVVAPEAMLVPPVLDWGNMSGEDEKEWW